MPRPKNPVPTYRHHKQSGQAIVTVNVNGARRDFTLGAYNSPESKKEYQRVLAQLEAGTLAVGAPAGPADLTVNELCLRFWKHALEHYRHPDGSPTSTVETLRYTIRAFRERHGHLPAREFGPLAFKALREQMVQKGWTRKTVNDHAGRVKLIVRWGVENELLPADRWEALRAVPGLAAGRTRAPDREPVGPVSEAHFRAALPFVRPHVRALLELLAVTGMRPGEACGMRPCEVDATGEVWIYRPESHKTRHKGKKRVVPLGARAQEILKPLTPAAPESHYFSPRASESQRLAEARAKRKTKVQPSQVNRKKKSPQHKPGARYTPHGIEVAVRRACERAGVPHWHPNQLRHTFATNVRKAHGLEAAQVLLGHSRADMTQIYAEKNEALAVQVARAIG